MCKDKEKLAMLLETMPKHESKFTNELWTLCLRTLAETEEFDEVKRAIRVFSYTFSKETDEEIGKQVVALFLDLNSKTKDFAALSKNETSLAN